MIKSPLPEQLTALNKPALDASLQFAQFSFGSAERLLNLNLAAVREQFASASKGLQAMTQLRDPQELLAYRGKFAEAAMERAAGFSNELYELAKQTQADLAKLVEERVGEFNKHVVAAIEKAVEAAPAGSEGALAAIKASVSATAAGMDSLSTAAKQVGDYVDAGVKATVKATTAAAHAAKGK